jgi:isopenicillin N synthase-like dioxygenase
MDEVRDKVAAPVARHAVETLPVIDVSPLVEGGTPASCARVAAQIRRACIDIGFFYISGHGIPEAELDEALDRGRRFFAAPRADKMRVRAESGPHALGYYPLTLDGTPDEYGKVADVKERFSASREPLPDEPERGRYGAGRSKWPDAAAFPGFADFFKSHIEKRARLTRELARAFALSLDLPESHFDPAFAHLGCVLMFNCYPERDTAAQEGRWNFSPHTDYGAFTILLQDHLGGLQVRNAAGAWIDAPPVPGTFVVNIGDMFAMWTNDLYVSTLHRVMNRADRQRLSMAFFTYPHGRTEIRCIETCAGPANPPRYEPVLAEEYNSRLVGAAHRTGRPGISERTATRLGEPGTASKG